MALLDIPLEYGLLASWRTLFETLLPVPPHSQVQGLQCWKGLGHEGSAMFSGVHDRVSACAGGDPRVEGLAAVRWQLPDACLLRRSRSLQPQAEDYSEK